MVDPSLAQQTVQLSAVWEDLMRIMPRVKVELPEELVRFKTHVNEIHADGGSRRAIDHHLFYRISAVLARQERPMTMRELSEALVVPPNTATRLVDWLVEVGYAERLSDRGDRRVVRVALTQSGRDLHRAVDEFVRSRTEQLLRRFSPEDRDRLVTLLRKLVCILDEELAGG